MSLVRLRDDLVTAFNDDELAQLCSRFGLSYQALAGNDQRDKAAVLIGTLERRGRLRELLKEVTAERPHLMPGYQHLLGEAAAGNEDQLSWLDQIAAGQGAAIEEPPTMKWESDVDHGDVGHGGRG